MKREFVQILRVQVIYFWPMKDELLVTFGLRTIINLLFSKCIIPRFLLASDLPRIHGLEASTDHLCQASATCQRMLVTLTLR